MAIDRPIPAFYCCYLLRSTVRRSSVYVGSTPNPVRRLRQHNGLSKGGAVRTSRSSMRPWEMTCIITGFPSHIAALQFEWAWQNPHITARIPSDSRIQFSAGKRPRHTVSSLLSNLHLLLRVSSFARWPLSLHFFSQNVYRAWVKCCKTVAEPVPDTLTIIQDFPPSTSRKGSPTNSDVETSPSSKRHKTSHGIEALEVGYATTKPHIEKAKNLLDFEQEGSCAICHNHLEHDAGIYTICPTPGCEAVTHINCLGKHFLNDAEDDIILPVRGKCPSCNEELQWVDVVKELSLRMRGQKEVEEFLKVKRVRKGKGKATASQAIAEDSEDEDEDLDDDELQEYIDMREISKAKDKGRADADMGDTWHVLSDSSSDSDTGSITSNISHTNTRPSYDSYQAGQAGKLKSVVIEDSDWDDADIID